MRSRGLCGAGAGAEAASALTFLVLCVVLLLVSQVEAFGNVVNRNVLDSLEMPYLASGDSLFEGLYRLHMREDCGLSLHKRFPEFGLEAMVWSSKTEGAGRDCFLVMQEDGDLVISTFDGDTLWSSCSGPRSSLPGTRYFAILQKNGNFAVKQQKSGWSIWESGTAEL